jgi:putative transposase
MPRQARLDLPGLVHHVMARGIEGGDVFRCDEDRQGFLTRLTNEINKLDGPRLYAWALMSNHFHLLLRPGNGLLSPMMRRLMTGHAVSCNMRHKRKGHLFQNRFKSIVVEEEPYFLELVRYIHLNPVRAGIVTSPEDLEIYPFAGHSVILGNKDFAGQDVNAVLSRFSLQKTSAIRNYRDFVSAGFFQGSRNELRGGGLVRSTGGLGALLGCDPSERESSDARILGSGDFVDSVLHENECSGTTTINTIDNILHNVSEQSGINIQLILGTSRCRSVSAARRQFYRRAHEEAGATFASLGRMTGRSHTSVREAILQARLELKEGVK